MAVGPVSTPLSKKLGPSAAGSNPTLLAQPTTLQTYFFKKIFMKKEKNLQLFTIFMKEASNFFFENGSFINVLS